MSRSARSGWTRRAFLGGVGALSLGYAAEPVPVAPAPMGPPMHPVLPLPYCAVLGGGPQGREMLSLLGRLKGARVAAVCDPHPGALRRAAALAPGAEAVADYRAVLDRRDCPAVIIATPTHQHRPLVEAALQAGKHVYCEAPLAASVDDIRAIARAARAAPRQHFQAGLAWRCDRQYRYLFSYARAGAVGQPVQARVQCHQKTSWRRAAADPARARELNWRLARETSLGLPGEAALNQLDFLTWCLAALPVAVYGVGRVALYEDGRTVADNAQAILEFPGGLLLNLHATLGSSFDGQVEMLHGAEGTLMFRGQRAWLFKESDARVYGWEDTALRHDWLGDSGIVLRADATRAIAERRRTGFLPPQVEVPPLLPALELFLTQSALLLAGERAGLPTPGWREGAQASLLALRIHQAVEAGRRLEYPPGWFEFPA